MITYINASVELGHADKSASDSGVPHAMKISRRHGHVTA